MCWFTHHGNVCKYGVHFLFGRCFYRWRCDVFLVGWVVNLSRNIKELYHPLVIKLSLHLIHRFYSILLRLVLNKKIPRVGTYFFFIRLNKPVVNNFSLLWKSFKQIFMIILHLLCTHIFSHVRCHCIRDSNHCRSFNSFIKIHVHVKVSFFILQHINCSKSSSLSLSCILGLSNDIIAITTVTQSNYTIDIPFKQFNFL